VEVGSTVIGTLPRQKTVQAPLDPPERRHVLVIEDDAEIASLLHMAMSLEGWRTTVTHTASQGLLAAALHPPDVVLCDLMLPEAHGLQLIDFLQRLLPELPVIVISADDDPESQQAAIAAGAVDFCLKPFSLDSLLRRMREV
jgi:DNA-binding response OmpR family regulator